MAKIKILVVEDEIIIADNICYVLDDLGYQAFEPAINFSQAVESLENNKPDIAILDIQLVGKKDGIDLAYKIKQDYNIPFIFLTSNSDISTIERVKKLDPHAFLVKPFNREELFASIEIALHNFVKGKDPLKSEDNIVIKDALFVKTNRSFEKICFSDILFLKSDHVYVEIHTLQKRTFLMRGSMQSCLDKLSDKFFRTHRSYIINLEHLNSFTSTEVDIEGEIVPIGKDYWSKLIKRVRIG